MVEEKTLHFNRVLTDEQERALTLDYKAGIPIQSLAELYNIDSKTVYAALRRNDTEPSKKHYLTDDEKKAIVADFDNGIKYFDIAKKYDVSSMTVYSVLAGAKKVAGMTSKNHYRNEYPGLVEDLEETDLSVNEICKKYGINEILYYKLVKLFDVRKRQAASIKKERNKALIEDFNKGLTYKEICAKYNITQSSFYRILAKNGIIGGNRFKTKVNKDTKEAVG